jgi:hypothetical protein
MGTKARVARSALVRTARTTSHSSAAVVARLVLPERISQFDKLNEIRADGQLRQLCTPTMIAAKSIDENNSAPQ